MNMATRVFLSIRQGQLTENDGFRIKAGKKRLDKDENLYYKIIEGAGKEDEIRGLQRIVKYSTEAFVGTIKKELKKQDSKNVLFFIHGYHPFKNKLHTYLLDELVKAYSHNGSRNGFGTVIFFSWPNRGLQWREDDEASLIGRILAHKYPGIFTGLKDICNDQGGNLYLMCQSFGHHILNSFVKHFKFTVPCFEKVFLLAADIPYQSLNSSPQTGIYVPNKVGFGGDYTHYNLTPLRFLSREIHVFYDVLDVILTASKINFVRKYERLGKTGPQGGKHDPKFIIPDYDTYKNEMYLGSKIKLKGIIFKIIGPSQKKYNHRHQYFYTNQNVVEIINAEIQKVPVIEKLEQ